MTTHRSDLYQIKIEVDDAGEPGHREITITAQTHLAVESGTCQRYGDVTDAALWQASQYSAGLLGRLAAWAGQYVDEQRRRHGCGSEVVRESTAPLDFGRPVTDGGCDITVPWAVMRPSEDYGDSPAVWLSVPTDRVGHWREQIAAWLGALADEQAAGRTTQAAAPATHQPSNVRPMLRRTV